MKIEAKRLEMEAKLSETEAKWFEMEAADLAPVRPQRRTLVAGADLPLR